jgi:nucleotide-binding universal stress UspA family protein
MMFERIVVGVTNQATAKEAAAQAERLAALFGAELHVVTAFDHKAGDDAADRAERMLDQLATASATKMRLHSRPGNPADAICAVASDVGADLIVVGNKGLAASKRVSGSVPASVAAHAPCSVLILDTL